MIKLPNYEVLKDVDWLEIITCDLEKRRRQKAEKEPLNYDNKKKRELKIKSCGQKLISIINVRHRDHCQT